MKLDSDFQKAMDEADSNLPDGEFEPLEEGFYLASVRSIKLSEKAGASGYKQWVVVWQIIAPKKRAKRTVWDRISLSPKAAFKMRELFDSLGFEYDSDSDELVGEKAIIEVITSPGENDRTYENVEKVYAADDEVARPLVGK